MEYRINGFEQIKSFYSWVFNNPDKVRPTHISLYLFLWNQGNRANWVEWFKCPYDLAMQGACIGNKGTYYRCLDDLQSYKLIKYKKGLNNYKAPQIHLIKLYDSEPLTEQVTVPLSEPQTEPLTELLSGNIYKPLTDNYKLVNINLESWIENHSDEIENVSKKELERSLLLDLELLNDIAKFHSITDKEVKTYLKEFCLIQGDEKVLSKPDYLKDKRKHFMRWIKLDIAKTPKEPPKLDKDGKDKYQKLLDEIETKK